MRSLCIVLIWCGLVIGTLCASLVKTIDDEFDHHPYVTCDTPERRCRLSQDDYPADPEEKKTEFWRKSAEAVLAEKEKLKQQFGKAKNIILFMGDGMSIPTLLAARVEKGRRNKVAGPEKEQLSFEKFPIVGLSKTYCVDSQVADSACTATAYLTGVKTNVHTVGINANVVLGKCSTQNNVSNHVDSIVSWAQRSKKSTGVVTNTRVTHASPSGCYAHVASREWEWDARITDTTEPCDDIAKQLVRSAPGKDINVVLGGGYGGLLPSNKTTWGGLKGNRNDQANLLEEWMRHKTDQKKVASVVFNKTSLRNVDTDKTDYLMASEDFGVFGRPITAPAAVKWRCGRPPKVPEVKNWVTVNNQLRLDRLTKSLGQSPSLFAQSHMKYTLDKDTNDPEPSLAEMTETAIKVLKKNPNGFFLFVEGGEIDFGHHEAKPHLAVEETLEFSKAIERAVELTSIEDTLIVVTADHAHTMSVSGYPTRGNDIFKLAFVSDIDNLPIATLSYANGPGFTKKRKDLSKENLDNPHYMYPSTAPLKDETHGGDDVGIYAQGPWSYLFTGVIEQNVIPMAMARAAQIGQFEQSPPIPGKSSISVASPLIFLVCIACLLLRQV